MPAVPVTTILSGGGLLLSKWSLTVVWTYSWHPWRLSGLADVVKVCGAARCLFLVIKVGPG